MTWVVVSLAIFGLAILVLVSHQTELERRADQLERRLRELDTPRKGAHP